jgi:FlaA1/EpsC-like NDP-sugar epimerase
MPLDKSAFRADHRRALAARTTNSIVSIGLSSPLMQAARDYLSHKRVLVTGACGTVGQELVRQLLEGVEIESLVGADHNETELMFLDERYRGRANTRFVLCDVRDNEALLRETRHIDVLFHAAAYKHVYICERSPLEAVQTNILGVQNVLRAALENGVERLVFTSTDKAVNPTNVMGTSKLMGERLVTAAAMNSYRPGTIFVSTRFGNVLGSRGSVIPLFLGQIRRGGPVTLSDPRMTRFIMSLDEAVRLVIESVVNGKPGDVLITKMPAINIADLAAVLVREYAPLCGRRADDIEIKTVGPKAGEKFFEELMNDEETRRSIELERYFVVRPALLRAGHPPAYDAMVAEQVQKPYNSANEVPLSQETLTRFLHQNKLIDASLDH